MEMPVWLLELREVLLLVYGIVETSDSIGDEHSVTDPRLIVVWMPLKRVETFCSCVSWNILFDVQPYAVQFRVLHL